MRTSLFHKVAALLAHLVHARLSPFTFLLKLCLLSLLARMILSLASTPYLHIILASTSTSLQGFNLNLDAAVFKRAIAGLEFFLIFMLANFIILALFFSAKGGSTGTSFDQAFASYPLEGEPLDSLTDYELVCYEPAIPSAPSIAFISPAPTTELPVYSAPRTVLGTSSATSTPSEDQQLQAPFIAVAAAPSMDPASSPLHINDTASNQLELVPLPQEINKSQKISVSTGPRESTASHIELVHTNSHGDSEKQSIASHRSSDAQDMRLCKLAHDKPSLTAPSSSMPINRMELVPTIADRSPVPRPNSSQKGRLFRHKSDIQTSSTHAANEKSLIRHKSDIQTSGHAASEYAYYGRTVRSTYYYEYTREESCSTTRLYTSSTLDSLSKEEANKHFSEFTSRKWASLRNKSKAGCKESPPPSPLRICS